MSSFQDRGGLSYGIDVRDGFSSNLARFRVSVRESREEWQKFRQSFVSTAQQTSKIRKDLNSINRALSARNKQLEATKRASRSFVQALGTESAARREDATAIKLQNTLGVIRRRSLLQESRAVRRLTSDYARLRRARGKQVSSRLPTATAAARLGGNAQRTSPATLNRQAQGFDRLNTSMARSGTTANRVSFTFRRLFGILAAFTAARVAVSGFNQLVASAVRLNAELEQSVLGVAGLLTALGDVSDPTGTIADNAERLTAAQGQSRRQLELLRVEALKTSASFQELADTFQVALAPGFQAGLDLDEIRRLTVQISQAAGAIGLPQNQLPEEIRSLLQGTITPRTTRIATALGITNEDIRNAKEAGELVEFLEERFDSFAVAGEAALKNFSTILINLRDGLGQILRLGGFTFFDALKNELNDILQSIATVSDTGELIFNQEAINVVREIGEGLRIAVEEASGIRDALDVGDLRNIARLIGRTISGLAKTGGPLLETLLSVLSSVSEVVSLLTSLGFINDILTSILGRALAIAAVLRSLAAVLGTVKVVLPLIGKQMAALAVLQRGLVTGAISWRVALATAVRSIAVLAPILAVASFAFTGLKAQAEETSQVSQDLVDAVSQLPVAISKSNSELEAQKELIEDLTDRFQKASNDFEVSVATAGLEGIIRQQKEVTTRLRQESREIQRQNVQRESALQAKRLKLSQARIEAEDEVNALIDKGGLSVQEINSALQLNQSLQEKRQELSERIAKLEVAGEEANAERIELLKQENEELRIRQETTVQTLRDSLALREAYRSLAESSRIEQGLREFGDVAGANLNALLSGELPSRRPGEIDPDPGDVAQAQDQIKRTTDALNKEKAVVAEIQSLEKQIEESRFNQIKLAASEGQLRALQIRALAEEVLGPLISEERTNKRSLLGVVDQETPEGSIVNFVSEETEQLKRQRDAVARLEDAYDSLGNVQQAVAQNKLEAEEEALASLIRRNQREVDEIQKIIDANNRRAEQIEEDLKAIPAEEEEALFLLKDEATLIEQANEALRNQIRFVRERNGLLEEAQAKVRDDAAEDLARTKDTFSNAVEGFREGLRQANEDVKTAFEISAETTLSAVQNLSSLIADSIVDAFDPTTDKTLEQRIGSFIQGIARQLLQLTTTALLFRAILGGAEGPTAFGRFLGFAKGGLVPQGFAQGGTVGHSPVRPKGIAASDTTPAWLTPGEFVVKKSAVGTYGADAIAAINKMLVDPGSLRSLAGLTGRRKATSRRPKLGYASGGLVSGTAASALPAGGAEQSVSPMVAIPADNATMETLLSGGKGAYFDFLQSNRNRVKSALGL